MKINTKIRYGLRMLLALADAKGVMNTAELGKKMLVSPKYLRKLAGPLEKHELITSVQGIYGGYVLNKKPEELTIISIFEAFKEKINISDCYGGDKICSLNKNCLARPLWEHLEKVIKDEFYTITLREILDNSFPRNYKTGS
ncbi:MAG TPA: Rrf2 family transcriptional regulator [Candidatus Deferrimicrobium sp.]|nr:Rrf2 family transcriptional regulator [Candidatus Deferrimicrobium sp.]